MNQSKIAVRYAKAFFEIALERKELDSLKKDIELIASIILQSDVKLMLESPVIKTSKKKRILSEIFKNKISDISLEFVLMITNNKREMHIADICRNFIVQYREYKNIKAAKVITATPITDTLNKKISKIISEIFKTDVELTTAENKDIIGGFILRVGDQQIDASVSTKLKNIKRDFLKKIV
jgi:F-type H+-transporting ATPase subunit delta